MSGGIRVGSPGLSRYVTSKEKNENSATAGGNVSASLQGPEYIEQAKLGKAAKQSRNMTVNTSDSQDIHERLLAAGARID